MKIAFSTLACPDWSWQDIMSAAKDFGFDGIEVRGLNNDIFAVRAQPFTEAELPETLRKLQAMRLSIPCYASDACLKHSDRALECVEEITEYLKLAAKTDTPFVRVLGDDGIAPGVVPVDDRHIITVLRTLAPIAESHGVALLVETNGVFSDTSRLFHLLEQVASDSVAALWDVHHPFRFAGETPEMTIQNLGAYIKHVHVKDSVVSSGGDILYRMMGEGDLPLDEMMQALRSINYEGFVTLEWVKRWSDSLEDPGISIPHFANYMDRFSEKPGMRSMLLDNKAMTGKYIWEKETLIDLTFPQLLDRVADEFPDQYAFRYTVLDYTRTYAEFREDVNEFARALISLGVRRGDKVAIWATNVPQWFITFWAATKIGAVLVTVNTAYKIHEAEYLLRQSDTHTLVMIGGHKDSDYAAILHEICPELAVKAPGEPLHARRL
ncbi:MAG: TIM barrel protein, partial [Clostridia bacterium]|nr:TIM barrel protein [Clostridia bacterium]